MVEKKTTLVNTETIIYLISSFLFFTGTLQAAPVISEIMAINDSTIMDDDGSYSDWIELYNPNDSPEYLGGWFLTDNPNNMEKWCFPDIWLAPHRYLVIYASGKDRRDPLTSLHTNFKLSGDGEYLALVNPDGQSVVSDFVPNYPQQYSDVSYGVVTKAEESLLAGNGSDVRLLIPTDDTLGQQWLDTDFIPDQDWLFGIMPIGFWSYPLLAYYDFEGQVLDMSGNEHHGIAHNVNYQSDVSPAFGSQQSLYLSGGYIGVESIDLGDQFTFSVWIKPQQRNQMMTIAANSGGGVGTNGFRFFVNEWNSGNGRIMFETGNGSTGEQAMSDVGRISVNQWNHLAVIVNRPQNEVQIFHNGQNVTVKNRTATNFKNQGNWHIGQLTNNVYRFFGNMDDFCIWKTMLSTEQIQQIAQGSSPYGLLPNFPELGYDIQDLMISQNASVYLRIPFDLPDPIPFEGLTLSMQYDDGHVTYLNGQKIAQANAPNDITWDSNAITEKSFHETQKADIYNISPWLDTLQPRSNVLAIQGLNASVTDPDFLINPTLVASRTVGIIPNVNRHFYSATPGSPNGNISSDIGPLIKSVSSPPSPLTFNTAFIVETELEETFNEVSTVTLFYRRMFDDEMQINMYDDGTNGDIIPNDSVYSAFIPGDIVAPGEMIRYRIQASDTQGNISYFPLFGDPQGSPKYLGTVVEDLTLNSDLPILHWFVEDTAAVMTRTGTRGAVYFQGEFYDNIFMRVRGRSAVSLYGDKQNFKFDFNRDQYFILPSEGLSVEEFNLQSTYIDKAYIRQVLAFETYQNAGHPSCLTFPMHVRRNNEFYSVAIFVEQVDEIYLDRHGLDPEGALYKFVGNNGLTSAINGVEKKTRLDEDHSDLEDLINSLNRLSGSALEHYLFDNIDIPSVINYMAATVIIHDRDHLWKNYYLYRDTNGTNEWMMLPWDKDLTFGRNWDPSCQCILNDEILADDPKLSHPFVGAYMPGIVDSLSNKLIDVMLKNQRIQSMFISRLQTLMQTLLQSPDTAYDSLLFEARIDYLHDIMFADVQLDYEKWGCPNYGEEQDFDRALSILKNEYLAKRREFLFDDPNECHIVDQYPSQTGNPDIRIQEADHIQEYIVLRNYSTYVVDISDWTLTQAIDWVLKPGTVIGPDEQLFVVRDTTDFRENHVNQGLFIQGNYSGRLSADGETIRLCNHEGELVDSLTY